MRILLDVRCEVLEAPEDGSIVGIPEREDLHYQDVIVFACDRGYRMEGSARSQCTATGEWSTLVPTCHSKRLFYIYTAV